MTIPNEPAADHAVKAAAAAYCRAGGLEEEAAVQTELVIEDVLAAIVAHEYLPGQKGRRFRREAAE